MLNYVPKLEKSTKNAKKKYIQICLNLKKWTKNQAEIQKATK